jgi:hypothetical protein
MSKKDKFDYDKFKEEAGKKLLEVGSLLGSEGAFMKDLKKVHQTSIHLISCPSTFHAFFSVALTKQP